MAQFGIQGCLATQEAEEEPKQDVVMVDDEVAVLKAQLAELQKQVAANKEGVEANADRIAKNTEIATIANVRSLVNRQDLLKTTPVKHPIIQEPTGTAPSSQTVKKKVSAPVPGFVVDLTLFCASARKTAEKSPARVNDCNTRIYAG